jgi:hypothetical protein
MKVTPKKFLIFTKKIVCSSTFHIYANVPVSFMRKRYALPVMRNAEDTVCSEMIPLHGFIWHLESADIMQ